MATERERMEAAEFLKALKKLSQPDADDVPEGWKTAGAWGEEWNMSESHARRYLTDGVKNGLVEAKKFRVNSGTRLGYPATHYKKKI